VNFKAKCSADLHREAAINITFPKADRASRPTDSWWRTPLGAHRKTIEPLNWAQRACESCMNLLCCRQLQRL